MIGFFHLALLDDIEMEIPLSEHLPENIIVELKQISAWLLSCKSDTVFLQDYVTIRSGLLLKSLNAYVCYILKHAGYCFLLLYVFYFFLLYLSLKQAKILFILRYIELQYFEISILSNNGKSPGYNK